MDEYNIEDNFNRLISEMAWRWEGMPDTEWNIVCWLDLFNNSPQFSLVPASSVRRIDVVVGRFELTKLEWEAGKNCLIQKHFPKFKEVAIKVISRGMCDSRVVDGLLESWELDQ